MKKNLFLIVLFLMAKLAFSQMPAQAFVCRPQSGYTEFSQAQVLAFISRAEMEGFRLADRRVTLPFDNGFDIILLSARELKQAGLISDISSYRDSFPADYVLPRFHLAPSGIIGAGYTATGKFTKGQK